MKLILLILLGVLPAFSLAQSQPERSDRIMRMSLAELAAESEQVLARQHSGADLDHFQFPAYVDSSAAVRAAYRIAVVKPLLLSGITGDGADSIPCYCSCESFGHKNLLWCFLREGKLANGFDSHGSRCTLCYGQAMLAFLWDDAGLTKKEILAAMEVKFARLLEKRKQ